MGGTPWPTPPLQLPVYLAFINTCVLVASSSSMHWALRSIRRGNVYGMRAGLLLTLLMGTAFLTTQVVEFLRIGFNTSDGAFPTVFFSLTGLHGVHVLVGLAILLLHADPRLAPPLHAGEPSGRRDRRHLLALRRRDVARCLLHRLPPLSGKRTWPVRATQVGPRVVSDGEPGPETAVAAYRVCGSSRRPGCWLRAQRPATCVSVAAAASCNRTRASWRRSPGAVTLLEDSPA